MKTITDFLGLSIGPSSPGKFAKSGQRIFSLPQQVKYGFQRVSGTSTLALVRQTAALHKPPTRACSPHSIDSQSDCLPPDASIGRERPDAFLVCSFEISNKLPAE